jgi:hypothetical protein
VAASGCDAHDPEWLYDMVWCSLTSDDKLLMHQALALESEWKFGTIAQVAEVDPDFQKLVQSRADLRVWLCAMPNQALGLKKIENCKTQVEKFTQSCLDDEYLFVTLVWENYSYQIESYRALAIGPNAI